MLTFRAGRQAGLYWGCSPSVFHSIPFRNCLNAAINEARGVTCILTHLTMFDMFVEPRMTEEE